MNADNLLKGNKGWAYEKANLVENTMNPNREPSEVTFAIAEGTNYAVALNDGSVFQIIDRQDRPEEGVGALIYDGEVYRYNYAEDGEVSNDMLSFLNQEGS